MGFPPDYPHHVVHYWLSQLFTNLSAEGDWTYHLTLSDRHIIPASNQLTKRLGWPIHQTAYLVFHPGAGSGKKCWPIECFTQLASRLNQTTDYRIVYLLGPAEQEGGPRKQEAEQSVRKRSALPHRKPSPNVWRIRQKV